jgi:hypothetical protein
VGRFVEELLEGEIRPGGDGGGDLLPGGGERRGEAGHGHRRLVAPHVAPAGDRQHGMGFAHREDVLRVPEGIDAGREVGGRRGEIELEARQRLGGLAPRLKVQGLPGGGRGGEVPVAGGVGDAVDGHGTGHGRAAGSSE